MHTEKNKAIVENYIQDIWNNGNLANLDTYVHPDYRDFSFLPAVLPTKEGLKFWVGNTSQAFKHETVIESMVAEGEEVAVRLTFNVKHIGSWRNIAPTGKTAAIKGFRFFQLREGKIIKHWGLIDGEALQTELTDAYQGCELPK